jgi:hypothetical protein
MGFEYVCVHPENCKWRSYRLNTDVEHDGALCPGCSQPLVKRIYGFKEEPVAEAVPPMAKTAKRTKKNELSEVDRLNLAREEANLRGGGSL